jgi:hypothetical protein
MISGGKRTYWDVRAHEEIRELRLNYEPSGGTVVEEIYSLFGLGDSDPAKVAQINLRLVQSDRLYVHLLLGSDAVKYAGEAEADRAAVAGHW